MCAEFERKNNIGFPSFKLPASTKMTDPLIIYFFTISVYEY